MDDDHKKLQILRAMKATLDLSQRKGLDNSSSDTEHADYSHLVNMYELCMANYDGSSGAPAFSVDKLNRWLGWMQGCTYCMANGDLHLDDFRETNKTEGL